MFVVVYPPGLRGIQKWRPLGFVDLRVDGLHLAFLLLGEKDGVDVGEDSSVGDGDVSEELVQLFVVADGELDVTRSHPGALVVLGGVTSELEKLGGEVLKYRGHVDRSSRADTLGETSLTKVSSHAANGELEPGTGGSCGGLALLLASFAFSENHLEFEFLESLTIL